MIDLKGSIDSQNIRNDNFNDRLINHEENKIKIIDDDLKDKIYHTIDEFVKDHISKKQS